MRSSRRPRRRCASPVPRLSLDVMQQRASDVARIAKPKPRCVECGRITIRTHPILDVLLCRDCQAGHPDKYGFVTKTRAMQEYRLRRVDLAKLEMFEADNPHYKVAAPMQLYLHRHVRDLAKTKYGNDAPYVVTLVPFSGRQLQWLAEDPARLHDMSPRAFQRFVADRLDAMGLDVQLVGDVNRKDGGVDLVAYPKSHRCPFPFLLAAQVKHHRTGAHTGARDVRDFHGAVTSRGSAFNVGLLVTNTTFTPDARWFGQENAALLRLRDIADLQRWLHDDFVNENEWREIPESIQLAPGIQILIPRPQLVLPKPLIR